MHEGTFKLYKRSNGYWYYWTYDWFGRRFCKSTGRKTKQAALMVCCERLKDGRLIDCNIRPRYNIFGEYAKDFYLYERCPYIQGRIERGYRYSRKNAKTNRFYLERYIMPHFERMILESITINDVDRWLLRLPKENDISNKTANNVLTLVRQILTVAKNDGLLEENPAMAVRPLSKSADSKRRVAFTKDQVQELFSSPWKSNIAETACRLACMTGMRAGEIRALWKDQIHDDYVEVNASYNNHEDGRKCTKSGYGRVFPISHETRRLLEKIDSGGVYVFSFNGKNPVSNSYFEKELQKRMKDLGIKPQKGTLLTFHSFRHYFNSRLIAAGIQGEKIRAVIGHEEEAMTEHYAHLEVSDLEQIRTVQRGAIA